MANWIKNNPGLSAIIAIVLTGGLILLYNKYKKPTVASTGSGSNTGTNLLAGSMAWRNPNAPVPLVQSTQNIIGQYTTNSIGQNEANNIAKAICDIDNNANGVLTNIKNMFPNGTGFTWLNALLNNNSGSSANPSIGSTWNWLQGRISGVGGGQTVQNTATSTNYLWNQLGNIFHNSTSQQGGASNGGWSWLSNIVDQVKSQTTTNSTETLQSLQTKLAQAKNDCNDVGNPPVNISQRAMWQLKKDAACSSVDVLTAEIANMQGLKTTLDTIAQQRASLLQILNSNGYSFDEINCVAILGKGSKAQPVGASYG